MTVAGKKLIKDQLHPINHGEIVQLVPTGTLSYRFCDVSREAQQMHNPPMRSVFDSSDVESLLSVDQNEEDIEQSPKIENINQDEQDSIQFIDESELIQSKSKNSATKRSSSSLS